MILLLVSIDAFSQSTRYFRKNFGDPFPYMEDGWTVITLTNGYLVGSNKYTSLSDAQSYLIKTDLFGNAIWEYSYNDTATNELIVSSIIENDCYYFAGEVYNPTLQNYDGYLLKTDSSGTFCWQKKLGDSSVNNSVHSIVKSSDNYLLMTGWIEDTSTGFWQGNLLKADTSGHVLWSRTYNGLYNSVIRQCIELPNGNLAMIGRTESVLGSGKVWLLITDSLGILLSDTSYFVGQPGPASVSQRGNTFDISIDGGFIVGGNGGLGPGADRGLLIKLNSSNQVDWYKLLTSESDGTGHIWQSGIVKVKQLPDSATIAFGSLSANGSVPYKMFLVKTDFYGNEIWRRYFTNTNGYHSFGLGMDLTPDGGFILTGRTEDSTNAQVYFVKTNCLGYTAKPIANYSVTWNGNTATFTNLSLRADTCIYYFGDGDSAVVHLSDTNDVVHQFSGPGPWQAYLLAFACGQVDTLYQTITTGINDFDSQQQKKFRIFPNPANQMLSIVYQLPPERKEATLMIYDISGKLVYSVPVERYPGQLELDISSLPVGSYQIVLEIEKRNKFVRQLVVNR